MNLFKIVKRQSPCYVGGEDREECIIFTSLSARDETFKNLIVGIYLKADIEDLEIANGRIEYFQKNFNITWFKKDEKSYEDIFNLDELNAIISK